MKTICISIEQLRNLVEVAEAAKSSTGDETTSIVRIESVEPSGIVGQADKLRYYLEGEQYDHTGVFLGTN